jgi:hypothetical protein
LLKYRNLFKEEHNENQTSFPALHSACGNLFVGSCGTAPSVVPSPSPESSAASSFSSPTVAPEEPDEKFGSDWLLWLKDYGSDEYRTVSKAELLFKSGGDQAEPSAFFTGNTQQGEPAGFG